MRSVPNHRSSGDLISHQRRTQKLLNESFVPVRSEASDVASPLPEGEHTDVVPNEDLVEMMKNLAMNIDEGMSYVNRSALTPEQHRQEATQKARRGGGTSPQESLAGFFAQMDNARAQQKSVDGRTADGETLMEEREHTL